MAAITSLFIATYFGRRIIDFCEKTVGETIRELAWRVSQKRQAPRPWEG